MITLADQHALKYSKIIQSERLKCLDITSSSLKHMKNNVRNRLIRESSIPDDDIENTVKQIINLPFLGGKKGSLKLQQDEKALVGSTTYGDIKSQLKTKVAKELLKRREQSELQRAQYKRYREKEVPFKQVTPEKKHQVWSIDFLNILLFGIYFQICVVYDIFSQSYLSIKVSFTATSEVAKETLIDACKYSGQIPKSCLLSDNGSQFKCYSFEETKKKLEIQSQYIPRGQPWYNGSLESGNRDLRKVIYTNAFYGACNHLNLSKTGVDRKDIYNFLQSCSQQAMSVVNEEIVRPKFKTTPMAVLKDQVEENQQKLIRFKEKKKQERKKQIKQLKNTTSLKRKRIEDKVNSAWVKISKKLDTEQLYAFSEMLNERYKAIMI